MNEQINDEATAKVEAGKKEGNKDQRYSGLIGLLGFNDCNKCACSNMSIDNSSIIFIREKVF